MKSEKIAFFTITHVLLLITWLVVMVDTETCQRTKMVEMNGDVILGGMFNIHERGPGGQQCSGRIDTQALQRLEAFLFAVDIVNKQAIIREKIGIIGYDTCDSPVRATNRGLELLARRSLDAEGSSCPSSPLLLGCVGDYSSATTNSLAALLTSSKITQISYGATATSLTKDYPYLVRTVPSDLHLTKALLDILQELKWQDIGVVYVDTMDTRDRKSEFLRAASNGKICVASVVSMDAEMSNIPEVIKQLFELKVRGVSGFVLFAPAGSMKRFFVALEMTQMSMPSLSDIHWVIGSPFINTHGYNKLKSVIKGLVSIKEQSNEIADFKAYYTGLSPSFNTRNPWFRKYWEQTFNCTVGVTCGNQHREQHRHSFLQAHGVSQVIAAVFTYAYAIRDARNDLCPGSTDLCPGLSLITADRLITYIKAVSFVNLDGSIIAFDENGDLSSDVYSISNIQIDGVSYSVKNVGTWTSREGLQVKGGIKMYDMLGNLTAAYPPSVCRFDCSCHNQLSHFMYGRIDAGSALIHGFFDIHGSVGSQGCNHVINEESVQALEAFYFAVDHINSHPRILPHIKIGATSSDSCRNTNRAKSHSRAILARKLNYKSASDEPVSVSAVLDATSSDVSLALTDTLVAYNLPHISATATAEVLSNKATYPSFLRTVGTVTDEVKVLVDIIKAFQWTYVKLVFSDDLYGKSSAKEFLRQTQEKGICVATQVELTDHIIHDPVSISNIVRYYLLEAFPSAKVVVLFISGDHMGVLFDVMETLLGDQPHDLVWLSGHMWGTRASIVRGHSKMAHGAITVDFQTTLILPFIRYFHNLHPTSNHRNPWFKEFWQSHFQCHLSSEFSKVYNQSCDPKFTLVNDNIAMATEVPYVIDGVYTYALALHKLLEDFCAANASAMCQAAEENMDLLYTYMKEVKFYNGLTNMTVSYDALGNGMSSFSIFNYQMDKSGQYLYYEVGSWKDDVMSLNTEEVMGPLSIGRPTKVKRVTSTCEGHCTCSTSEVSDMQYEVQYARLTLLGYFPIHDTGLPAGEFCKQLQLAGFIAMMAFQYAIQRVNNDPNLLPNVTLGYMIFDTCSSPDYARMSFNAFDKSLRFFGQARQLPVLTYVHAFVGSVHDNVTKALNQASYAGQRLVQISPASASADLNSREKYPYFLRTVGNEETEAFVLVALLQSMGWSYISIVTSSDPAHVAHADTLHQLLTSRGICIAAIQVVPHKMSDKQQYHNVVDNLLKAEGAFGVVLVMSNTQVELLFETVHQLGVLGRFYWLGTTQWVMDSDLMRRYRHVARGALQITLDMGDEPYLDAFIQRLQPDSPSNTPWIREFWQEYFQCRLDYNAQYPHACTGRESLNQQTFSELPLAINTINAVYAFAYGLTNLFKERCGGMVMPPCDAITLGPSTSTLIYDYIRRSHFVGADGKQFSFMQNGDARASYMVVNYQVEESNELSTGRFIKIARWSDEKLHINRSDVYLYDEEGKRVELRSVCRGRCNCSKDPLIIHREPPALHMVTHLTVWGVIVLAISLLGCMLALITAMFFMIRYRHPVVLGSTSSLSLMLLGSISSLYLLNFAFMLSDTMATCLFRRLFLGIFYAMIFAVLLIKVIRIGRICNKAALSSKPSFISGSSQTAIACLLGFIQMALAAEWVIIYPPEVTSQLLNIQTDDDQPIYMTSWSCNHTRKSLVYSLSYVYALILLTFIYAFRARKAANYQHEALCILLTSVSAAVILTLWAVLYTEMDPTWGPGVTCIAITTTASAAFALVFTPKMLILTAVQGGTVHSEPSASTIDYHITYPATTSRNSEPSRKSSFRTPHPFPLNELSEQNMCDPYSTHQTEAF